MATRKTAPLDSGLVRKKGAAVPAQPSPQGRAAAALLPQPREEPIALTVKLDPELYIQLKPRGMRTKPRKTNQQMMVEAIRAYLSQESAGA